MFQLPVQEIFSSIQGEGPYAGVRQIFLRLPECNLACPYCDTKKETPERMRAEKSPGSGEFIETKNPIGSEQLLELLVSFDFSRHHSLSVTGGEPLLWADELGVLLPPVRNKGLAVYLETNGTLPEQLRKVADFVDIISMDVKLPYVTAENNLSDIGVDNKPIADIIDVDQNLHISRDSKQLINRDSKQHISGDNKLPYSRQTFWDAHREFLQCCKDKGKEVFVKIVVHRETPWADLEQAGSLIAGVDASIVTVLQPVTERGGVRPPVGAQLLEWQGLLLRELKDVRVVPQVHGLLQVL